MAAMNEVGCLLLHGFSGRPADLGPLADALAGAGYTVEAPALPGHGESLETNVYAPWQEWVAAVAAAHDALAARCGRVIIIGHSMGGALALVEAARRAPAGLVLLGAATSVGGWRGRLLPVLRFVAPWFYPLRWSDFDDPLLRERVEQRFPGFPIDDEAAREELRRRVRVPTAALQGSFTVARRARGVLGRVTAPTLIVHGRRDTTTLPASAEEMLRRLGSRDKQIAWFAASGHQLILGTECAAVVERIVGWIEERR